MGAHDTPDPEPTGDLWIVGCGDLGTAVGRRARAAGWTVWASRRKTRELPEDFRAWPLDVAGAGELRPPPRCDRLLYAVAAGERTERAYRAAYPAGLARVLAALREARLPLERALFVSSTAVWPDAGGAWVDEATPVRAADGPTAELIEAERVLADGTPQGARPVAARLGGIYGPGRTQLVREARRPPAETDAPPDGFTNRIHRDDAADALWHLLELREPPATVAVVDDRPALRSEVLGFLREQLGSPTSDRPEAASPRRGGLPRPRANRRIRNDRLRATGFELRYPSYREGYGALLAEERTG